jgi:hypothetical protein
MDETGSFNATESRANSIIKAFMIILDAIFPAGKICEDADVAKQFLRCKIMQGIHKICEAEALNEANKKV